MVKHFGVLVSDSIDAAEEIKTARKWIEKARSESSNDKVKRALAVADGALRNALYTTEIDMPEHIAVLDERHSKLVNRLDEGNTTIVKLKSGSYMEIHNNLVKDGCTWVEWYDTVENYESVWGKIEEHSSIIVTKDGKVVDKWESQDGWYSAEAIQRALDANE